MSQSYMPPAPYNSPAGKSTNTLKIVLIVLAIVIGLMVLACGILAALLIPAVSAAREAAKRQMASNNLKQIGLALLNYESAYRKLPALHGTNHDGQPTGNWRVVILPFVEATGIFNRFDFHKAWDAPDNQAIANEMPAVFRSPLAEPNQPPGHTNMFSIQDPNSLMPSGGVYRKLAEVIDGTSNTIAVIELPNHSVPWMQPKDLTIAEAIQYIRAAKQPELIQVLILDGSVKNIGKLSDADIAKLITINEGANVNFPDQY